MKVLVIGNSVLSNSESNGRILRALLNAFPNATLFSFGLRGVPDCAGVSYQTVTDRDALLSFATLGLKKPIGIQKTNQPAPSRSKNSLNAKGHVLRDAVWFSGFWRCSRIRKWETDLEIGCVFLMAADAPFLYRYAVKIAKKKSVPLIVYSSEDYPLKKYDYMAKRTKTSLMCKLFLRKLRKEAKRAFEFASETIFGCKELETDFSKEFRLKKHHLVYQPASINKLPPKTTGRVDRVIYGGNINRERLGSIIDIAREVKRIRPEVVFDVYGPIRDDWSQQTIKNSAGLFHYRGIIAYPCLLEEYSKADLLIHAEGFDDFVCLDYAHSFSTKIGDCYLSGVPFFQYGPASLPCIAFGASVCPTYTAVSSDELAEKLGKIVREGNNYSFVRSTIEPCFDRETVGGKIKDLIESAGH